MSIKAFDITKEYNREVFLDFLRDFLPDDFEQIEEQTFFEFTNIEEGYKLGFSDSLNLDVYEFRTRSNRDPRVTLTKEVVSCIKNYGYNPNALAIFYSLESNSWRFSLITTDYSFEDGKLKRTYSNPRRFSFKFGKDCKRHTPEQMLFSKGQIRERTENGKTLSAIEDLKSRFAIEVVTKQFYKELFAWYEWASEIVTFPKGDTTKNSNGEYNVIQTKEKNNLNLIRLITRLMFVWFIKQKNLIPSWIFDKKQLMDILTEFNPESDTEGNYYNAVIQNLFFATLNKKIEDRAFADDERVKNNTQFGVKNYYRDNKESSFFKESNKQIIERFKPVPFLNGGLFECLDKLIDNEDCSKNIEQFDDGFSREPKWMAFVPNHLFWQEDDGSHEGILHILNKYNFTVEENTPSDIQVALDPELLGKVFENLLGSYNPETSETARKDSGSFYTPREIVNFMVDESLKNYLTNKVNDLSENQLDALFNEANEKYTEPNNFKIIQQLKNIKILDPACGSGAFPMGCLQRIVQLIQKCDEKNYSQKDLYELKLELIEKCLYGIDIQPIAVQICKLRFFISLICEQNKTNKSEDNYGFNPLPNLETKFVAANSLIGLKEKDLAGELFKNPDIDTTKNELQKLRHNHFNATTTMEKALCRKKDKELRNKLIKLLKADNMYDNEQAKQLSEWNPYDQNVVSSFFDSDWMFNVSDGFDIVIGNPPYISTKGITTEAKKAYEVEFGFSDDTYNLFTFKGVELTKINGTLNYIIPKTFWTTQTKRNMRDLILSKNIKYIFDTANPFDSVLVDTCIIQIENSKYDSKNLISFLDGTQNIKHPKTFEPILQNVYINTQNSVIFKPTEKNLKIWNLYGKKVKDLYNTWWEKIETSKKISQNQYELTRYRNNLKPGDIALLGCLTEGGQGLATANNGKYIAVRKSSKWAKNIKESRPKKLAEAIKKNPTIVTDIENKDPYEFLSNLSENEIATAFDELKEKYGRDIFGQGYIYKLIDDSEIADVDTLTDDEKINGISTKKNFYVPYDKGDKDGNRWYLETPFAIAWSKENVQFLKTNSGKKGEGMPVVRNPQFNFKEGFCWNNVLNPNARLLKAKMKSASVNDVGSMSLTTLIEEIPNYYFVSILNSEVIFNYYREFINCTVNIQINDIRQVPVVIPSDKDLEKLQPLFKKAVELKKTVAINFATEENISNEIQKIESEINKIVEQLYGI